MICKACGTPFALSKKLLSNNFKYGFVKDFVESKVMEVGAGKSSPCAEIHKGKNQHKKNTIKNAFTITQNLLHKNK